MSDMTKEAIRERAINIFEQCAPDMGDWDLEESADFVADRLYDEFGKSPFLYKELAVEALKPYF
jgi:hypothetical protein